MTYPTRLALASLPFFLAVLPAACTQAPPPAARPTRAPGAAGDALLDELPGQEKVVAKLPIVKREHDDFQAVTDALSETAGRAYDDLGELGEADASLDLADTSLPAGERAAREAVAASTRDALLTESGEE